jgi:cation transport regulator ChaC
MHNLWLALVMGLMLSFTACEKKKEEGILPKVDSASQIETGKPSSIERDAFIRQVQQEIDKQAAELADIRNKAAVATGQAKDKLEQQLKKLEQEKKIVDEKLAGLKASVGEKWKELKADVVSAIDKFRQSVKSAM